MYMYYNGHAAVLSAAPQSAASVGVRYLENVLDITVYSHVTLKFT